MATNKTLFINSTYVQDFSTVELNVDSKYITPNILSAQESFILPILGSALYSALTYQVSASTLTAANTTLLDDYVRPALCYFTLHELTDSLVYKYTNSGIMKMRRDDGDAISIEELNNLLERTLRKANSIGERLSRYLIANPNLYPLYATFGNTYDSIQPLPDVVSSSGVFTPSRSRGKYKYDKPGENSIPLN